MYTCIQVVLFILLCSISKILCDIPENGLMSPYLQYDPDEFSRLPLALLPAISGPAFEEFAPNRGLPGFPQEPPSTLTKVLEVTALPPGYICVPVGTCNPSAINGIDIRIVTPSNMSLCPPGQTPCPSTAVNTQCGLRSVSAVNTTDGFATPGAYPWMAYIVNRTGFAGGGVIVDQFTILTAAHKVYMSSDAPESLGVYVGAYDSTQLGTRYVVQRILLHPNFNPMNLFNDVALLRLVTPITPITQPTINTACLPLQGQTYVGQRCWVSGWGKTAFSSNDAPTLQLKQVQVPIVSFETCFASMSNASVLGSSASTYLDNVGELCAGGEANKDACTQDGGSPLVCNVTNRFTVVGLVIWGKGCGQPGVFGVYANVANYVYWISNSISAFN